MMPQRLFVAIGWRKIAASFVAQFSSKYLVGANFTLGGK
jgi:hypothetical protein